MHTHTIVLLLALAATAQATDLKPPHTAQEARSQAAALASALNDPAQVSSLFSQFMSTPGMKPVSSPKGLVNFKASMAAVAAHNKDSKATYFQGLNKFAGQSYAEFKSHVLATLSLPSVSSHKPTHHSPSPTHHNVHNPSHHGGHHHHRHLTQFGGVDWRANGKVTPIRDQAQCGCCWAFAATAAVESMYLIQVTSNMTASTLDLSEQQLTSCATNAAGYWSNGCSGGSSDGAIQYVHDIGQTTEAAYPYSSGTGTTGTCNTALAPGPVGSYVQLGGVSPVTYITASSESALMSAVNAQPVIIYFDVESSFQLYSSGTYNGPDCTTAINHAMVVVGYSYTGDSTTSYWIVKNSWGTWWGESGYVRVQFGGTNTNGTCGMYLYPMVPTLSSGFTHTLSGSSVPPSPAPTPSPSPKRSPKPRGF